MGKLKMGKNALLTDFIKGYGVGELKRERRDRREKREKENILNF